MRVLGVALALLCCCLCAKLIEAGPAVTPTSTAARTSATCSLAIKGSAKGLQSVQLNCTTSSGQVVIGFNSTYLAKHKWHVRGATLDEDLPCQKRAAQGDTWVHGAGKTAPHYPLLFFCGAYNIHLLNISVTGVHLQEEYMIFVYDPLYAGASEDFSSTVLAFGGNVNATLHQGVLQGNKASNVVRVTDNATVEIVDMLFQDNTGFSGAGVIADQHAEVRVQRSTFTGMKAVRSGAGVAVGGAAKVTIEGCSFVDTISNGYGGGVAAEGGSTIHITASTFTRCKAEGGGGVSVGHNATMTISDCSFMNIVSGHGGVVVAWGDSTTHITASNFARCMANYGDGGGVSVSGHASMTIVGCSFMDITGHIFNTKGGGVVALDSSTTHITASNFTRCTAYRGGGGVFVGDYAKMIIGHCLFMNTTSGTYGGGVAAWDGSTTHITASNFTHCTAGIDGGGVYIGVNGYKTTTMTINGCSFVNTISSSNGGGVAANGNSTILINASNFTNCTAEGSGGGVSTTGNVYLKVNDCLFVNTISRTSGGGVALLPDIENVLHFSGRLTGELPVKILSTWHGKTYINGSQLMGCSTWGTGGGVFVEGNYSLTINGTTFWNAISKSSNGGGLAAAQGSVVSIKQSEFTGCTSICGGAIYLDAGSGMHSVDSPRRSQVTMSDTVVSNNTASSGGGICADGADTLNDVGSKVSISEGCRFNDNSARFGAGDDVFVQQLVELEISKDANIRIISPSVVSSRQCEPGEESKKGICQLCAASMYSLDNTTCKPCNATADCSLGGAAILPQSGFWHGGKETNWAQCKLDDIVRCPNQQACMHDATALAEINPYNPRLPLSQANWTNYGQKQCSPGYTGLLCSSCLANFGQTETFICLPCVGVNRKGEGEVNKPTIILILSGSALGVALLVWITVYFNMQENLRLLQGGMRRDMEVTDVIKILIMYWQYLVIIVRIPITWPKVLLNAVKVTSWAWGWAFGSAASLDCLMASFDNQQQAGLRAMFIMIAPVVTILFVALCHALWWWLRPWCCCAVKWVVSSFLQPCMTCRDGFSKLSEILGVQKTVLKVLSSQDTHERPPFLKYMRQHGVVTLLVTVFFFYPAVARVAVGMFSCMSVCKQRYWVWDMRQVCPMDSPGSPQWRWAMGMGVPAVLFCIGVPLFMVVFLSHAAKTNRLDEDNFRECYGFLYSDNNVTRDAASMPAQEDSLAKLSSKSRYWVNLVWGAVIHCQTMLLVVASVYGKIWHEFYQVLVISGMLAVFLILILIFRPFRRNPTQWLQAISTAVLYVTCFSIIAFVKPGRMDVSQTKGSDAANTAIALWVLVINIIFLVVTMLLLFYCMIRELTKERGVDYTYATASSNGPVGLTPCGRVAEVSGASGAGHASGTFMIQQKGAAGRGQPDVVVVELASVTV